MRQLTAEIEKVKGVYAALNRNDIPEALKDFDVEAEHIEFEGTPMAGAFRGLSDLKEHFARGRGTWAEGSCEPDEFHANGDRLVVFVHVRVKLKKNLEWVEGRVADVFTFRDGKILEMRTFLDRKEALEWAGAKA